MSGPFRIGFLLYPGLTQLDLTGPAQVLSRMSGAEVHFVWKTTEPVMSDCGLALMPTVTLADCPRLDLVCVPGGYGCFEIMADEPVLAWLRQRAETARLVTSVCTGSLILAAAGLLEARPAATHWAWRDDLARLGAVPTNERVVVDGDRITGGGVTAGIDFAFRVVAELRGQAEADALRLVLEYDPAPGAGGTPETAAPETLTRVRGLIERRRREAMAA